MRVREEVEAGEGKEKKERNENRLEERTSSRFSLRRAV